MSGATMLYMRQQERRIGSSNVGMGENGLKSNIVYDYPSESKRKWRKKRMSGATILYM
jgi:hypothetical protein